MWVGASSFFMSKCDNPADMNTLFWADGSAQMGLGHLFRTALLASALKEHRDATSTLLTSSKDDVLSPFKNKFELIQKIPDNPSYEMLFQLLSTVVERTKVSLLITDRPHYPPDLCHHLKRFKARHIRPAIVAFGAADMPPNCVDMVIDANRDESEITGLKGSGTTALLGPRFAALAPPFAEARSRFVVRDSFERLIISMGGSDPNFATFTAYRAALRLKGLSIDVVLGPAFPEKNRCRLEAIVDAGRTSLHYGESQEKIAQLFARADACILSGGITMFEAAAVGLPVMVISQNEAQLRNAESLASRGAVVNAGLFSETSSQGLASTLSRWQSSRDARLALSTHAREAVDGNGIERICTRILQLLTAGSA